MERGEKMWESATRGWKREDAVTLGHCLESVYVAAPAGPFVLRCHVVSR